MFYFQTMFQQALDSIDSFSITSGVVGVAETILLLSFLYSAYPDEYSHFGTILNQ